MKARTTLAAATALAVLALCATAAAAPDSGSIAGLTSPSVLTMIAGTGDDAFSTMSLSPVDPSGHPTQHYGPYTSTSPDSSTCGNDWAEDTFDRDFTVRGTTVVEQFKNGSFVTMAGPSPGARATRRTATGPAPSPTAIPAACTGTS